MVPLMIPTAVLLSEMMGVGGWWWPRSMRARRIGIASHAFMQSALISDSAADVMAFLIVRAELEVDRHHGIKG